MAMNRFERMVTAATAGLRQAGGERLVKTAEENGLETYEYATQSTCSKGIVIRLEGDVVREVQFIGGCPGGLAAVGVLVSGMKMGEVAAKVQGIPCRNGTSCGDQLAKALTEIRNLRKNGTD